MPTIAAAIKHGQVAIAADSQTTTWNHKETAKYVLNHQKIFPIGESFFGISGPASGELAIQKYFSSLEEQPKLHSICEIYDVWNGLHRELKDKFFLLPHEESSDAFESTRINSVIINSTGLYFVEAHRSVQQFSKFFACGSGDNYALGAMFIAYQDDSKSAEDIARLGVEAAAEWDTGTGAPISSHSMQLEEIGYPKQNAS